MAELLWVEAAPRKVQYVRLEEPAQELSHKGSPASTAWWATPAMLGAPREFHAHFGTDMQQGCWLTMLGCLLYFVVMMCIVAQNAFSRVDKWLELLAAAIFVVGGWYLVESSYPASMMALLEKLAAPQKPNRSFFECYVTSNTMMLSTQIFNLGMLPYLVEGVINTASPPADDPPGAALSLLLGCLIAMPLLFLFSAQTSEDAMRANGGLGTTHVWDGCLAALVGACGGSVPFWRAHVGSDSLFVFWVFFLLMALSAVPLLPLWLMDPIDAQQLCGVSMSCGASLLVTLPFALGTGLMLRAAYPENASQPPLLGQWVHSVGRQLHALAGRRALLSGEGRGSVEHVAPPEKPLSAQ